MSTVTQLKTRVERWAEKINATYSESVQAIIEVGRQLQQAKAECSHGEWGELTGRATGKPLLPFSHRTAERFKAVSANAALSNATHVSHLPASWGTLAVLASLDPDDIEAAIADGTIHPEMQRKDAEALKAKLNPPKQPAASKDPAQVIRLTPPPMSDAERQAIDEGLKEGGRLIAEYAERQAENAKTSDALQAQFPLSNETQTAEALAADVLARLKSLDSMLASAEIKPRFNERWQDAIRYADSIRKQLEQLT